MKRMKFSMALSGSLLLCAAIGVVAAPNPPNVIMILIDDMGWSDSAPYGSRYYDTPNLTRLAREGIRNLKPGPEGESLNERLARESIRWISAVKDSGQPFYLNFWHYAVHGPIIPQKDLLPKYIERRDPNNPQRCPQMATMLDSMDNSIGILLDWLDKPANRELKENTLILLTSDNGGLIHNKVNGNPWTSNRPLRGGKANTYEGGVREPWIVRWPGKIKAGTVCRAPVQSVDIYPTFLEIAGVRPRDGIQVDGQSIVRLLKGEAMEHQPIFTHFPHYMGALCAASSSVRTGDNKPRQTHALVLEGAEWVRVKNNPDGSVKLSWNAAPEKGVAKILFGWKGGTIPQEINSATIPACELEVSALGSKATREFVMQAPPQVETPLPEPKRRTQEQFFKSRDRNGDGTNVGMADGHGIS